MIGEMRGFAVLIFAVLLSAFTGAISARADHGLADHNHEQEIQATDASPQPSDETTALTDPVIQKEQTNRYNTWAVLLAAVIISTLVAVALTKEGQTNEPVKRLLFWTITAVVILTTAMIATLTVYTNVTSVTKGPVHWHADYEVWACGTELDLVDPPNWWINFVGTPTFHEHNDKRLHVEGPVTRLEDISLGRFFELVGGSLTTNTLVFPTNEGRLTFISGRRCPDGSVAELQVFVYEVDKKTKTFRQRLLEEPSRFVMEPSTKVPPGNCVIIEFGPKKTATDRLCLSYEIAKEKGELRYVRD